MATVKVSEKNYEKLNKRAGTLRSRLKRPVSVDEALSIMMKESEVKPSDFFATFSMSDEEARSVSEELGEFWSRWNPRKDSS